MTCPAAFVFLANLVIRLIAVCVIDQRLLIELQHGHPRIYGGAADMRQRGDVVQCQERIVSLCRHSKWYRVPKVPCEV